MVSVPVEEIRRSPVEVGSLSHYLQGFIRPRWLAGFLPSTVVHINSTPQSILPNDRFEYPPRELYNISHFTQKVGKIIDSFQCRFNRLGWDMSGFFLCSQEGKLSLPAGRAPTPTTNHPPKKSIPPRLRRVFFGDPENHFKPHQVGPGKPVINGVVGPL